MVCLEYFQTQKWINFKFENMKYTRNLKKLAFNRIDGIVIIALGSLYIYNHTVLFRLPILLDIRFHFLVRLTCYHGDMKGKEIS